MPFDGIAIFSDEAPNTTLIGKTDDKAKTQPVFADAYLFEDMRMEVSNERSQLKEQLTTKVSSADYTAEEKDAAYEEMAKLTKLDSTEALMEMQIMALGYPDAFVRAENGAVSVTVLSSEGHSKAQADEISHYVMTTWEEARDVQVEFKGDMAK